ncbi:FAD-binding domain-containing protein [Pseudoruegeria sp. SHC-113]|uniref:FAD-binding domain-containing protein n=1 Tax=Pseudoruegeria sp. SHC-113 TaxID=2855439 RepID=UPI0021BB73E3|nr:FAD-binding domain-containing protein [Pseudoruegeria sp. SHC-113]MCT8159714.1 deoxyribodipyrimidine photo-lyase [Pseudoruegeria sp. SHC-113]
MATILWFKRDLRVQDNAALRLAAGQGPVIPLYICEPEYWALPDSSGRQWSFLRECLPELARDLTALGAPLQIRTGDAVAVLEDLRRSHGVRRLVSHEETGNLWTFRRDLRVGEWAKARGVDWQEVAQPGIERRSPGRDGWASRRTARFRGPLLEPCSLSPVAALSDPLTAGNAPQDLAAPDPCPARQRGGRAEGLSCLGGFLSERGQHYRKAMSSPLEGEAACSRLSPHLAFGSLSPREAAHAGAARQAEVKGTRTGWRGSLASFQARLAWRDHFMQKLEDAPRLELACLHPAYEALRPRTPDQIRLNAFFAGETGVPFVDACMRMLAHTGWLNFRMRAMVMSFASYNLWLDWRATAPLLAQRFTDYEPGIHLSQCQMQSGVTGMNTVRIYNPVKQGQEQDPDGIFTRRWLPELSEVPEAFLQTPWAWSGAGALSGARYPQPLVDPIESARAAREAVFAVRRQAGFREAAAKVVKAHASRKPPRTRRRKPARGDARQLDLGL